MLKCKPLFLFILGSIILRLIQQPICLGSGGLASSFSFQGASKAVFWSPAFSASKYKKVGKCLGVKREKFLFFWNLWKCWPERTERRVKKEALPGLAGRAVPKSYYLFYCVCRAVNATAFWQVLLVIQNRRSVHLFFQTGTNQRYWTTPSFFPADRIR